MKSNVSKFSRRPPVRSKEVEEAVTVAVVVVEGGEAGLEGREVLVLQQENDLVTGWTFNSLLDDGRQLGH